MNSSAEIRALALKTVSNQLNPLYLTTNQLLDEAERIENWVLTGERVSPHEKRQEIGREMRRMAEPRAPFPVFKRPIMPPELDKPDAELSEDDIVRRGCILHEQECFDMVILDSPE